MMIPGFPALEPAKNNLKGGGCMTEFNSLERIRELCAERGWSYYHLAKASGITYSTLNTMMNKQNQPSLLTLQKLCGGFGISISEFFDPDPDRPSLTREQSECLSLFTTLSAEDKKLALAYMKGLAKSL